MKDADACITPASVAAMAQIAGVTRLSDEAAKALAPDVDARLREIIQDAQKFARHAKRVRLTPDDVNAALRLRNFEPMFGYVASKQPKEFARLPGHPEVSIVRDRELSFEQVQPRWRLERHGAGTGQAAWGGQHGAWGQAAAWGRQHGAGRQAAWDGSSNAHSCEPSDWVTQPRTCLHHAPHLPHSMCPPTSCWLPLHAACTPPNLMLPLHAAGTPPTSCCHSMRLAHPPTSCCHSMRLARPQPHAATPCADEPPTPLLPLHAAGG